MKVGAQYYTIRDFCQTIEDFDSSCKKVANIGYKSVQLSGIGDFAVEEIEPILDKYGLSVVCTHRRAQNYLENLEAEIAFHKTLNCKICGLGSIPIFSAGKCENLATFIKNFKPISEKLVREGLVLAYHNHAFEFEKIDGKNMLEIICSQMPEVKLILDVYWLAYAGINPAKFIKENRHNIACVHFKDLTIKENLPTYTEIGAGNLDWDDIIAACLECGITDVLVEQDSNWINDNPFDSFKMSYDFLKEKGL